MRFRPVNIAQLWTQGKQQACTMTPQLCVHYSQDVVRINNVKKHLLHRYVLSTNPLNNSNSVSHGGTRTSSVSQTRYPSDHRHQGSEREAHSEHPYQNLQMKRQITGFYLHDSNHTTEQLAPFINSPSLMIAKHLSQPHIHLT